MAVNSTSSTATAPRTSFARRERVGTGTGGRMATSALLQLQAVAKCGDAGPEPRDRPTGDRAGPRVPPEPPFLPAQRAAGDGVPRVVEVSSRPGSDLPRSPRAP